MLHELAKETKRWVIGGSIPERDSVGKLYNTSYMPQSSGGSIAANDGIQHYLESRRTDGSEV